jgi:hypothetical protein
MTARKSSAALFQWVVVLVVGIVVVALVLGLDLIPRLSAGQKILNAAAPAFTTNALRTDVAGITIISKNVNMADPIVRGAGGAASEVGTVVGVVAKANHISDAHAVVLLRRKFPHTTALLVSIPLSAVVVELPHLEAFLEKTLKLTPAQLVAALHAHFPAIYQTVAYLPYVTSGWYNVPGLARVGMTDFHGVPVRTVSQLRDYFQSLIAAVGSQKSNFDSLNSTKVDWIPWVVLAIGVIVILFSLLMIVLSRRGVTRRVAIASASVVVGVGALVVALVLVLNLIPRLSNGQTLIDTLNPAFAVPRVKGDRYGINTVGHIATAEDPIMTRSGGAAAEVPKLVAFVSKQSGLSRAQVLAALQKHFPHTTAVLLAIPLSAVTKELPAVARALPPGALSAVPRLAQTVTNTPPVTSGWNKVPGTAGATNFQGGPVQTVPQIVAYFSNDVIPVLEKQRRNWVTLTATSRIGFIGWLVFAIGVIALVYGLLMVYLARNRPA